MQQTEVQWDFLTMQREPTLAIKLYVLVALVSLVAAAVHFIGSLRTARALRHSGPKLDFSALQPFRNRARSLKQWMLLDCLAWAVVTTEGLGNIIKGIHAQKFVGSPLMLDVCWDLFQPLIILLWVVSVLFLVRWHVLWRTERFEMCLNSPEKS